MSNAYQHSTTSAVPAGGGLADVCLETLNGSYSDCAITVKNVGANATSNLMVLRQFADGGDFVPWISGTDLATATADYSPSTSPPPNAIPAGQTATLTFKPGPVKAVKVQAASAAGTTLLVGFSGRQA